MIWWKACFNENFCGDKLDQINNKYVFKSSLIPPLNDHLN